jgi:hypothetical protein
MAIRKSSSSGIPFGNTAGRPANPGTGQLYSNGQLGRLELYTETGWQNIVQETPGVASISGTYNQSAGSGTFTISGSNFVTGGIVYAVGTNGVEYQASSSVTNSIIQMTATFTGLSPAYEPYDIKVLNPSNLFGLLPDAFFINDNPVWSTSAGSLGTYFGATSIQLSATDDEETSLVYSVSSGALPTGLTLSSSGLISGTINANPGTYTFTVSASDGVNTGQTRSFSLVVSSPTITGGTITVSGDYRIHTFTSNGTFATNRPSLNVDYLVVAGGGGGGNGGGGGGGAGGLRSTVTATGGGGTIENSLSLPSSNNYSVTIGSGGNAGTGGSYTSGSSGTDSTFYNVTATGGGGGTSYNSSPALSGGSGGGGMGGGSSTTAGGAGTSNQGFRGGNAVSAQRYASCGGGGAGQQGADGVVQPTVGGNGVSVSITGTLLAYAGGGGGGSQGGYNDPPSAINASGGSGGGGAGSSLSSGTAGTANLGGGGGGGGYPNAGHQNGGNGGSGVVIIRYLKSVVGL